MRLFLVILMVCLSLPAQAATLRPITTLHGPTVSLHDLFDDPGQDGDRILGPGPAPGGRLVVESAQLGAIARQFEVDWRPTSKADRVVLEWPGQPMKRDDAVGAVRAALVAAGASPDCAVALLSFSPPLIPVGAAPRPLVSQLDYDSRNGRFTASLSVAGAGMEPISIRVTGQVETMIEVPVAATRLPAGAVARAEDVRMARVNVNTLHGEVIHTTEQIVGQQLTRPVPAGQPLMPGDLTKPTMVKRGTLVALRLESGGLSVTGQGMALESGAIGDRIKLRNPGSRTILEGVVIGPDLVRVAPNTRPESVAARGDDLFTR